MILPDWAGYQRFRNRLAEANRHDFYSPEWMDAQVARGMAWPILGEESAMVVGVRLYPGGAIVGHVKAAVGDMQELVSELAPKAEDWARMHGCSHALLEGREGWKRALKDHGWSVHQLTLLKDLRDGQ
jgi:hypothetical protein